MCIHLPWLCWYNLQTQVKVQVAIKVQVKVCIATAGNGKFPLEFVNSIWWEILGVLCNSLWYSFNWFDCRLGLAVPDFVHRSLCEAERWLPTGTYHSTLEIGTWDVMGILEIWFNSFVFGCWDLFGYDLCDYGLDSLLSWIVLLACCCIF